MIIDASLVIFGYLLGSLASAVIVCKLLELGDPRQDGSCNPGATNVLRLHGKKAAIMALAGDILKGILPVLLARYVGAADTTIALTGLAAFIGHLYPVFFSFRGGKGVATLLGVLLASSWPVGTLFVLTWGVVARISGYSSLAGIIAGILAPAYSLLLLPGYAYTVSFSIMALLLIWRHRSNIQNLLNGTEPRAGKQN